MNEIPFTRKKDRSSSPCPPAIITTTLIKTAPYILLTYRRVKTYGRLLPGARYCLPRGRLSPASESLAPGRKQPPRWAGGPPARRRADTGRRGTPAHPALPARQHTPGPGRSARLGQRGPPAHRAQRRALPCHAVPCRVLLCHPVLCHALPCCATPCPALPPPAGRQPRKGGPGCPRGRGWGAGPCGRGAQRRAGGGSHMCPALTAAAFKDRHKSGGGRGKGRAAAGRGSRTSWRSEERPPTRLQQHRPARGEREEADGAARAQGGKEGGGAVLAAAPKSPRPRFRHGGCLISILIVISCRLCPGLWRAQAPCAALTGCERPPACLALGCRREWALRWELPGGTRRLSERTGSVGMRGAGPRSVGGRGQQQRVHLRAGGREAAGSEPGGWRDGEGRWEEWKALTIPGVMVHRSCSPASYSCFSRRKGMFCFNASPKHSVIKCSLLAFFLWGNKKKKKADGACLARKTRSKDEEVSCSKARQPGGRGSMDWRVNWF